ncbi:MAG: glutamate ligase domain-containing protein, partial [Planctomycetota bacterium JB042]
ARRPGRVVRRHSEPRRRRRRRRDVAGEVVWFDPEAPFVPAEDLRLRGAHNAGNVAAAAAAAARLGVSADDAARAARGFAGLPHRLQTVHVAAGVSWVDDSIATTPRSACAALDAFVEDVVLLAGGVENGVAVEALAARAAERARVAVTFGASGPRLARALRAAGHVRVVEASDLAEAVAVARDAARSGEVVLLAPAFPSYDAFRNYVERGERFRALAMDPLKGGPSSH